MPDSKLGLFARRENVYFNSHAVKDPDAFLIICTITSSPIAPSPVSEVPHQSVPRHLLETMGSLLDDPTYSDVEFVFPRRGQANHKKPRRILANRKLMERAEYFKTMFSSGFAETSDYRAAADSLQSDAEDNASEAGSYASKLTRYFEDSDVEDEDEEPADNIDGAASDTTLNAGPKSRNDSVTSLASVPSRDLSEEPPAAYSDNEIEGRNLRAKLNRLSSTGDTVRSEAGSDTTQQPEAHSPNRLHVVVKDVAYITYRAVLYYLYTDGIVFAPLSSSFNSAYQIPMASTLSLPNSLLTEGQNITGTVLKAGPQSKLGLHELKERAYQHVVKSLTVQNIAHEVFSPFSAAFEEVRKVQVAFFLEHWSDIRASEAMSKVWLEIRSGRHPGFEEVWPVIAQHLEFRPQLGGSGSSDA
ncbi:hypothetical protein HWV62_30547 [Athelia sp. TMB]|nr:hypothetical protein HWV62_30547 [Athelia sp. TMB]